MHVGIDATNWSNKRGFGRFTRELVSALAERDSGIRYTLFFDQPPAGSLPDSVEFVSVSTHRTMRQTVVSGRSRNLRYFWQMAHAVHRVKPDAFFFPSSWSYFPLISRVPCVICIHDAIPERFSKDVFPRPVNRFMWHAKGVLARLQASRVMTISQTSAGEIVQHLGVPADRIDLVTEGPGEAFQPNTDSQQLCRTLEKYGLSEKHDLLVYLGGMNRHKNVQTLLQAMQHVVAEAPNTHLVIIGDVTDEGFWTDANRLQAMVADCPILKEHAHFTGYLPDREAAKLLNAAKALVFPSLAEGFGLPAVEAMACGTPVLSSDRGSLPEVVGDAGLYFNPEDVEDMAAQILGFLRDEGLQTRLSRLALERSGNFTWARAAELAESSFRRSLKKVRVDKFRG